MDIIFVYDGSRWPAPVLGASGGRFTVRWGSGRSRLCCVAVRVVVVEMVVVEAETVALVVVVVWVVAVVPVVVVAQLVMVEAVLTVAGAMVVDKVVEFNFLFDGRVKSNSF